MASLTTLPHTALRRIVNLLPRRDALHFCISHPNLYNNVKLSRLYHTIHFLDPDAKVYPEHRWHFDENRSTAIKDLSKFAHTMESSDSLRSLVSCVSFGWDKSSDAVTRPKVLRTLQAIGTSLQRLHYGPSEWDLDVHKMYQVTSVSMPYPESSRKDAAIDLVYSLFAVPTLRQVTLHHLRNLFPPKPNGKLDSWPDKRKARTSNVEHLSIKDTSTIEYDDLEQIMFWPKGLKVFDCNLGTGTLEEGYYSEDPSTFVSILKPQRRTLEQLSVDFDDRLSGSGTFGTSLREFPRLKRVSIPRSCLANFSGDPHFMSMSGYDRYDHLDAGFEDLHLALPPALEELVLNVEMDLYDTCYENEPLKPQFRAWVRNVLVHKQKLYPSLKTVVLWDDCLLPELTSEGVTERQRQVIEFLDVSQEFKDVGVEFSYHITSVAPTFDDSYLPYGENTPVESKRETG